LGAHYVGGFDGGDNIAAGCEPYGTATDCEPRGTATGACVALLMAHDGAFVRSDTSGQYGGAHRRDEFVVLLEGLAARPDTAEQMALIIATWCAALAASLDLDDQVHQSAAKIAHVPA